MGRVSPHHRSKVLWISHYSLIYDIELTDRLPRRSTPQESLAVSPSRTVMLVSVEVSKDGGFQVDSLRRPGEEGVEKAMLLASSMQK